MQPGGAPGSVLKPGGDDKPNLCWGTTAFGGSMWLIEVGVAPENSRWGKRGMGVALLTISPIEDTGEAGFEEISTSSSMWLS